MADAIHPVAGMLIVVAIGFAVVCGFILLMHILDCCIQRRKAAKQAQAPENAAEEGREMTTRKAADDALAELQHSRELVAARADGWNQAHVAMEQERRRLEDEGAADRQALQELVAVLVRDEVSRGVKALS